VGHALNSSAANGKGEKATCLWPLREMTEPEYDNNQIRLIVGLGNPGPEYEGTRHNIGFALLERLAEEHGLEWKRERKFKALVARRGSGLILVKPLTYMNLSGTSIARLTGFFKVPGTGILVAYDDVALPLGTLRLRASGSSGGHNGIKSIIECLGHEKFPRLRIGIGAPGREDMVEHVLGRFEESEREELEKILANAAEAVNCALSSGLNAAMNRFNRKPKPPNSSESTEPADNDASRDHETEV